MIYLRSENNYFVLVEEAMNAQGIKLAEKYHDFNTLIQICEATNNQERLEGYITKFFEAVSKKCHQKCILSIMHRLIYSTS